MEIISAICMWVYLFVSQAPEVILVWAVALVILLGVAYVMSRTGRTGSR